MLETWNLVRNYTHICIFRKYIFSTWTPYFLSAFFSKKSPFFDKITTFSQSNSMRAVLEIFQFCFHPANICLDEDVWRCLEDVFRLRLQKTSFKTSFVFGFRRRLQDVLIKTNIFALVIRLQKTFSRRLQDVFVKTNVFALAIHLQDVFKTSWRPLPKAPSRHLQDVLKTFWRCLQGVSRHLQDVWPGRLQDVLQKCLQDIFKTSCKNVFKTSSRRLEDAFKTSCKDIF